MRDLHAELSVRAARFTVVTPECIRLEYSPGGRFVDEPSLFAAARRAGSIGETSATIVGPGDRPAMIDTGRIRLDYAPDGLAFRPDNVRARVRFSDGIDDAVWHPGRTQTGNLGGALRSLDGVRGPVSLPDGLLSRDGWYLLDDSATPLLVDGWVCERPPECAGNLDWYLFGYGRDYAAALRSLAAVSGRPPMPRKYMLGSWYSRYWPYTSQELRQVVRDYDEADGGGFPLDVMVLDMDWHRPPPPGSGLPGWTGWSWNRDLLPDAEELLAWLRERGLAVTLNLHPADGVRWFEDRYGDFMRRLGRDTEDRPTVPFDAGNRAYMRALLEEVHAPLERDGVDFWWMDWQQDEWAQSVRGLSNVGWLNAVYFDWTGRQIRATAQLSHRRGAAFGRWGGWGDHRHGVHFSGDVHSGWRALAFVVEFTLRSAGSGCCLWSHDIGGHFGARDEEAMTRWAQFGALSAAIRVHSARSARLDRRPGLCEPLYRSAMRKAYELRSRLMPTLYTAMRMCHEEMRPLLRPMWFDHPADEQAYRCTGQYLLGELLVAPIVTAGIGESRVATAPVWFPRTRESTAAWYAMLTGERFEAGSDAIVAAEIDEIPLFAPGGVPVVMQQATRRMGSEPMREMTVQCFPGVPGQRGRARVYEDDGISTGYAQSEFAWTEVTAAWAGARAGKADNPTASLLVMIEPTLGSFSGQPMERSYIIELGAVSAVTRAQIDGEPAEAVPGPGPVARIHVPARSIRKAVRVEIEFKEVNPRTLAEQHRRRRATGAIGSAAPADQVLAVEAGIAVRPDAAGGYRLIDSHGLIESGEVSAHVIDAIGGRERSVSRGRIRVEPGIAARLDEPSPGLSRPPLGLRASRLVDLTFRRSGRKETVRSIMQTRLRPLFAWLAAGPFPFDHTRTIDEQRHGPEIGPTDSAAAYRGVAGEEVRWRHAEGSWSEEGRAGWAVDFKRMYGGGPLLAYAVTHVWSPSPQRMVLHLESGDRMEAWVNRDKVFSMDTGDTMDSAAGTAPANLEAGWNRIAVKVSEGGGGFGFTAAIDGEFELREAIEPD